MTLNSLSILPFGERGIFRSKTETAYCSPGGGIRSECKWRDRPGLEGSLATARTVDNDTQGLEKITISHKLLRPAAGQPQMA